jgi:hypothetical protein
VSETSDYQHSLNPSMATSCVTRGHHGFFYFGVHRLVKSNIFVIVNLCDKIYSTIQRGKKINLIIPLDTLCFLFLVVLVLGPKLP